MVKVKKKRLQLWWIFIPVALIVLFGIWTFSENILSQTQQSSSAYALYQDSSYGLSIEYPKAWKMKTDTHVFENGDIVAFQVKGPTQKRYTEFIDGARFVISKPFTIDTDLKTWMKSYFNDQARFSEFTLAKYPFEEVEDCSSFGCMRYYFTMIDNQVYGVFLFAEGTTEESAAYDNTLLYMFQSLTFDKDQKSRSS